MHLGLIGYGGIAKGLLSLANHTVVREVTVLVRSHAAVPRLTTAVRNKIEFPVRFVTALAQFVAARPALIVECAGHEAVASYVPDLLAHGRSVIIASVGALADEELHENITNAAKVGHSRMILPSGAIGGLDILRAAAQSGELQVTYRGLKPAHAWEGSPASDVLDLATLKTAKKFFSGTGREAAISYPKNANVVAALALAGAGFDELKVELIADPDATGNQHSYTVVSPVCKYSMTIESVPSAGNVRTSMTTILSILQEITDFQTHQTHKLN
jgi:aspartate dehydrogenase